MVSFLNKIIIIQIEQKTHTHYTSNVCPGQKIELKHLFQKLLPWASFLSHLFPLLHIFIFIIMPFLGYFICFITQMFISKHYSLLLPIWKRYISCIIITIIITVVYRTRSILWNAMNSKWLRRVNMKLDQKITVIESGDYNRSYLFFIDFNN